LTVWYWLDSLYCADVPLRNCSLTHTVHIRTDLFLFLPELDVLWTVQLTVQWQNVRQRLNHSALNLHSIIQTKLHWIKQIPKHQIFISDNWQCSRL